MRNGIAAVVLVVSAATAEAQARPTDALAWLQGCWERRTPNLVVQEAWSSPAGGMLHSYARTIRRDTLIEWEFIRVYSRGDTLVYEANPSRQARTEFRAVPPFEPEVVFANPAHDFPQRVIYRRAGRDSLYARIEGERNGQTRTVNYPYKRVPCTPAV